MSTDSGVRPGTSFCQREQPVFRVNHAGTRAVGVVVNYVRGIDRGCVIVEGTTVDEGATRVDELDSTTAWLQALAAFVTLFALFGVAYSFGAFFGSMAEQFGASKGLVAGFFSISTFLYFTLGIFTGRIADRVGARPVMIVGAIVMTVGLILTSLVNNIWLAL